MWDEAEKLLRKDKYIQPLIKKWGICTIKRSPKIFYFKDLVESIANQQLSGKAASTIFSRFEKLCKGKILPDVILKLTEDKLRSAGFSFPKVKYIKDLAQKVADGRLDLENLDDLPDEDVITELVKVKGIGRWTAEMFLMFSLARPDIFPVDDLGIKKGFRLLRTPGSERFEKAKNEIEEKEKMSEFALKHWSPYRTVASWYLWRSLENR